MDKENNSLDDEMKKVYDSVTSITSYQCSVTYVHPTAIVDSGVVIGNGTKIWHWTHIMTGAQIGDNCTIGQNCFIASSVIIGRGVKIQNNVSVYDNVIIEDDVFIGPSVVFTNVLKPRAFIERKDEYKKTIIRQGATIGANATIICGNVIGRYAFVGAGATITKDIPAHDLWYGPCGQPCGCVCVCGNKVEFIWDKHLPKKDVFRCLDCGKAYNKMDKD